MLITITHLLALVLFASALSTATADACDAELTWRAKLIGPSMQGACPQYWYNPTYSQYAPILIDDFTVLYRGNDCPIRRPYPPILFANATFLGAYLGGALASAAGYDGGFTWTGTCLVQSQGDVVVSNAVLLSDKACTCNVNLQPGSGTDLVMYMACATPIGQCLSSYNLMASNASSHD